MMAARGIGDDVFARELPAPFPSTYVGIPVISAWSVRMSSLCSSSCLSCVPFTRLPVTAMHPELLLATATLLFLWRLIARLKRRTTPGASGQRIGHLPFPPGPKRLPLIGNLRDLPSSFEWKTYHKWSKELGAWIKEFNTWVQTN